MRSQISRWRIATCAGGVALSVVAFAQKPAVALAHLTVPASKLPEGCRLAQVPPAESRIQGQARLGAVPPPNPRIVTDVASLAALRGAVAPPPLPEPKSDVLMPKDVAAQRALQSDHVIEGYTARYLSAENDGVTVTAVRFDSETLAASVAAGAWRRDPNVIDERVVIGPIVARVQSSLKGRCAAAIVEFVRGLK